MNNNQVYIDGALNKYKSFINIINKIINNACIFFMVRTNKSKIKYLEKRGSIIGYGTRIMSMVSAYSESYLVEIGDDIFNL